MTCDICGHFIEMNEMRHSNGEGNYHIVCEYNLERKKQGMPPFETTRSRQRRASDPTSSSAKPERTSRSATVKFNNVLTSIDRASPSVI